MDCFSGSGTTLDVAHRLERRWIGIDNSPEAIKTTLERFANELEPMGDFVKKLEKLEQLETEEATLPMFDLLQANSEKPANVSKYTPIREFELLAAEPYDSSLEQAVANWISSTKE